MDTTRAESLALDSSDIVWTYSVAVISLSSFLLAAMDFAFLNDDDDDSL